MGRVEAFRIDGCRCWFFSHDHLDPHFHAKSPGEWEVRIFFLEEPPRSRFAVVRIPAPLRKQITELATMHRVALQEEWSRKVKVD